MILTNIPKCCVIIKGITAKKLTVDFSDTEDGSFLHNGNMVGGLFLHVQNTNALEILQIIKYPNQSNEESDLTLDFASEGLSLKTLSLDLEGSNQYIDFYDYKRKPSCKITVNKIKIKNMFKNLLSFIESKKFMSFKKMELPIELFVNYS